MAPDSKTAFTACIGVCQRKFSCTIRGMSAFSQVRTMALASLKDFANGFWQMAGTLWAAAISTNARWLCTVVAISTKSKPPSAKRAAASP